MLSSLRHEAMPLMRDIDRYIHNYYVLPFTHSFRGFTLVAIEFYYFFADIFAITVFAIDCHTLRHKMHLRCYCYATPYGCYWYSWYYTLSYADLMSLPTTLFSLLLMLSYRHILYYTLRHWYYASHDAWCFALMMPLRRCFHTPYVFSIRYAIFIIDTPAYIIIGFITILLYYLRWYIDITWCHCCHVASFCFLPSLRWYASTPCHYVVQLRHVTAANTLALRCHSDIATLAITLLFHAYGFAAATLNILLITITPLLRQLKLRPSRAD